MSPGGRWGQKAEYLTTAPWKGKTKAMRLWWELLGGFSDQDNGNRDILTWPRGWTGPPSSWELMDNNLISCLREAASCQAYFRLANPRELVDSAVRICGPVFLTSKETNAVTFRNSKLWILSSCWIHNFKISVSIWQLSAVPEYSKLFLEKTQIIEAPLWDKLDLTQ